MKIRIICIGIFAMFVAGCAIGDGRGFATVDGTLDLEFEGTVSKNEAGDKVTKFETIDGTTVELSSLKIVVSHLQLESKNADDQGTSELISKLNVGQEFELIQAAPGHQFGPFEIDAGNYQQMAVIISQITIVGTLGGTKLTLKLSPEEPVRVSRLFDSEIDVQRGELPLINFDSELRIATSLFDKVVAAPGEDAAKKAQTQIVSNLMADANFQATFIRKAE